MNHLSKAIAEMHAYYVGKNDDLEGFFDDLSLMILANEDDIEALPEDIEDNLQECRAMDEEDEDLSEDVEFFVSKKASIQNIKNSF